jgi:hypothetical protein
VVELDVVVVVVVVVVDDVDDVDVEVLGVEELAAVVVGAFE